MLQATKKFLMYERPLLGFVVLVAVLGTGIGVVHATLLNSTGVIDAPAIISDDEPGATNNRQQAFMERQQVTLLEDVRCSNTTIAAGEVVDSHMIFYNTPFLSPETDANRVWEFGGEVICVMAERSGLLQALTDNLLGAPGTSYPGPFDSRGLETDGTDSYTISGNTLTLTMTAEEPGDWIRVLTKAATLPDTTAPVVYCEPDTKKNGSNNDKIVTIIGADETDGAVDIYLTDSGSSQEFGPFAPGTRVQLTQAKGAAPSAKETKNDNVDYTVKFQDVLTIHATDAAGNKGQAQCSS